MKTTKGLLSHAVDLLTAAIGWIDMEDKEKAKTQIKLAIGVITEIQERLIRLVEEFDPGSGTGGSV